MFIDLSNFFNKTSLNIPSSHFLLALRVFPLGFLSIAANSELYEYTRKNYREKKVTVAINLLHAIMIAEFLLFLRNYPEGMFDNEAP